MSGDSSDATAAPPMEKPGHTAQSFKQLQKNKRQKIIHQKQQYTEKLETNLLMSNGLSMNDNAAIQAPLDGDDRLSQNQDATATPAGRSWTLSERVGGRYIPADPLISPDEKYLILANDSSVKVFSVDTSLILRKLAVFESEIISAYALSTAASNQLYAATSAGTIHHWNFVTGDTISVFKVPPGIIQLCVCQLESEGVPLDVLLALHSNESKSSSLKAYRTPKKSHRGPLAGRTIFKTNFKLRFFNTGNDGKVLAVVADKFLMIGLTERLNVDILDSLTYLWREIPLSESIRSLDLRVRSLPPKKKSIFSPSNFSLDVALGCDTGVVMVFDNLLNSLLKQEKADSGARANLTPRRLHWHFEPVNAVRWSADGNYIISGGSETVIVIWQLDTGKQQFLPHLSASIEKLVVSSSGKLYAVHLGNNSVIVLSTTDMKPVTSISSIQARTFDASWSQNSQENAMVGEERISLSSVVPSTISSSNSTRILLAVPATQQPPRGCQFARATFLQTYDIFSDQHVARQALTRTNTIHFKVSPEGAQIIEPDVKHIVASSDGRWLASVDEWEQPDQDLRPLDPNGAKHLRFMGSATENFLKIWSLNGDSTEWSLVTRIVKPHSSRDKCAARVLDILSHPHTQSFVSLGEDGSVRFWAPKPRRRDGVPVKGKTGETLVSWACVQTVWLATPTLRSNSMETASLAYSADASVLAVSWECSANGHDGTVYFIDPFSGKVAFTRNGLYAEGPVKIGFVERYLIVLSNHLRIYDMVNDRLEFSISTKSEKQTPKDRFLTRSLTKLSVHPQKGTFAIAVPILFTTEESGTSKEMTKLQSVIAVFRPERPQPLFSMNSAQPVTSLLAVAAGFTMIDAVLNLNVISPRCELDFQLISRNEQPTGNHHWIENAYGVSKDLLVSGDSQVMLRALQQPTDHESIESRHATSSGNEESISGRINRGQLAELFDGAPSYALPPVSQLFERVAGLVLGRRES